MRVALVQLSSGDMPLENLPVTEAFIRDAAAKGAEFILTPEVTNIVSTSRRHQ
ncbi:MAG: putative amidohydrolase, partial [Paracoccaceae bacterium]